MSEYFLHLDAEERREILETLATDLGRKANVLEKDVWVCWALEAMFSIPSHLPMAFKGGTSLSKVFNAISRFSEDIDITVDYRALAKRSNDDFEPFAANQTNNQIRKFSDRLKTTLKDYAATTVLPHIQSKVDLLPYADDMTIEHSEDGEQILIYYTSVVTDQDEYLRSRILIELGGRNIIDPNAIHTVTPDIALLLQDQPLVFPSAKPIVLAPERTFWEKATLIHAECNRGSIKASSERMSRHWMDLHLLKESAIGQSALAQTDLLHDVIKHKQCFFRSGFANYDQCLNKGFKLIPPSTQLAKLQEDYRAMQIMIYGDIPLFEDIVTSLKELEAILNALEIGCLPITISSICLTLLSSSLNFSSSISIPTPYQYY